MGAWGRVDNSLNGRPMIGGHPAMYYGPIREEGRTTEPQGRGQRQLQ